jgi:hypothetical protein
MPSKRPTSKKVMTILDGVAIIVSPDGDIQIVSFFVLSNFIIFMGGDGSIINPEC